MSALLITPPAPDQGCLRHYSNLSTLDAASDMTKGVVRGMNGKSNYYSRHWREDLQSPTFGEKEEGGKVTL